MAEAYKPYLEYLTAGGAAETAYLVAKNGAILATNLPIEVFPSYNFEIEDENDPAKTNNVVVEEGKNFIDAMEHNGRTSHPAGLRLYNQKYYMVRYDDVDHLLYLKKVPICPLRNTEEPASPPPRTTTSSPPSTSRTRWRTESARTPENSTSAWRPSPTTSRSRATDTLHHNNT